MAFSAGGDGGRRSPELLANSQLLTQTVGQHAASRPRVLINAQIAAPILPVVQEMTLQAIDEATLNKSCCWRLRHSAGRVATSMTGETERGLWRATKVLLHMKALLPICAGAAFFGAMSPAHSASIGFIYENGSYTSLKDPGAAETVARDINNRDQVVGNGISGSNQGFVYSGDSFMSLPSAPGAICCFGTAAFGINDSGQIVGSFVVSGPLFQGYVYSGGNYTILSAPGATGGTVAIGINDAGQVVGWTSYLSGAPTQGFLYSGGNFIPLNVPGASNTFAWGINNAGQIAGEYDVGGSGILTASFTAEAVTLRWIIPWES